MQNTIIFNIILYIATFLRFLFTVPVISVFFYYKKGALFLRKQYTFNAQNYLSLYCVFYSTTEFMLDLNGFRMLFSK